jgi:hypothetical protein
MLVFYPDDTFPNMDPDILIQYNWKDGVLEIAIVNELRDLLRVDKKNGPLHHIPEKFGICGHQIKREQFRRDLGFRIRIKMECPEKFTWDPPDIFEKRAVTISYQENPEPLAYFYWEEKTGSIKTVSGDPIPGWEDKPLVTIPLLAAGQFFGSVDLSDYQVVFRDGKHVIRERPKYNYVEHKKKDGLFGIYYSPWEKTMEVRYYRKNPEDVTYWISKAGDPTLLVEKIEVEKGFEGTNTYKLNTDVRDLAVYQQEEDGFTAVPFGLLRGTDIAQLSIGSNALNPELVAKWNSKNREIEFVLNRAEVVEEGFDHLYIYITKEGDPYYLIQSHLLDLRHMAEGYSTTVKVRTDQDRISVFTRQIFESSALTYV